MISAKGARLLDPVTERASLVVTDAMELLDSVVRANASMGYRSVEGHGLFTDLFDFGRFAPSEVLELAEVMLRDRLFELGYFGISTEFDVRSKSLDVWFSW
jgi:hypothetical protein